MFEFLLLNISTKIVPSVYGDAAESLITDVLLCILIRDGVSHELFCKHH